MTEKDFVNCGFVNLDSDDLNLLYKAWGPMSACELTKKIKDVIRKEVDYVLGLEELYREEQKELER
jgi:hypothetical protein